MEKSPTSFASLLRAYRLARQLSQGALAERAGLSTNAISELERGTRRAPYRSTVQALADALGMSVSEREELDHSINRNRKPSRFRGGRLSRDGRVRDLYDNIAAAPPGYEQSLSATSGDGRLRSRVEALSSLIGRDAELDQLMALLSRDEVRLITILGPPGVGKTRLALASVEKASQDTHMSTAFLDLTTVSDSDLILKAIGAHFGVRDGADTRAMLHEHLGDRPTLIVLDNFEQVLPGAQELPLLLAACPALKIVATSRERLKLRSEHVLQLRPLPVPTLHHEVTLEGLMLVPSVALFVDRAIAANDSFRLSADNARDVAELCIRLDGLPLAIELAAARTALLSPRMILERIADRLSLLQWQAGDLPARQQTLRAAIAWSYDLLTDAEQLLFRRMGVFAGSFTQRAAEKIAVSSGLASDSAFELLASLAAKNLLVPDEIANNELGFRLLDSVRDFAVQILVESNELGLAQADQADYCLEMAAVSDLAGRTDEQAWFRRVDGEYEDISVALTWFARHRHVEHLARLTDALSVYWGNKGTPQEERHWLEAAAKAVDVSSDMRIPLLARLGALLVSEGELAQARKLLTESATHARARGRWGECSRSLVSLGRASAQQGDLTTAEDFLEEASELARRTQEPRYQAYAFQYQAGVALLQGNSNLSESLCDAALRMLAETRFGWLTSTALNLLLIAIGVPDDVVKVLTHQQSPSELVSILRGRYLHDVAAVSAFRLASVRTEPEQAAGWVQAIEEIERPSEANAELAARVRRWLSKASRERRASLLEGGQVVNGTDRGE